jgi:hypothetical protein
MKRRKLENHLRSHGCHLGRHGARHDIWVNPRVGLETAVPRHNEIQHGLARAICRQLSVPAPPGK